MRKETVTFTYYKFDELSEAAKEKARDWYRQVALYDDWYEHIIEDAKIVGLKIGEFDLGRSCYLKAKFIASAEETAYKIETEHGKSCRTFIDAKAYLEARDKVIEQWEKDDNGEFVNQDRLDISLDALDSNFLYSLCEDYRIMLQEEMEYRLSDEAVDESICCNEYEFTEEGKRA